MRRTSATVVGAALSACLPRLFQQALRSGGTEFHGIGNYVGSGPAFAVVGLDYMRGGGEGAGAEAVPLAAVNLLVDTHGGYAAGVMDLVGDGFSHSRR